MLWGDEEMKEGDRVDCRAYQEKWKGVERGMGSTREMRERERV